MKPIRYMAFVLLSLTGWAHGASLIDGDATLMCAVVDLASCVPGEGCQRETASTMNVPQILQIDRKSQDITGKRPGGELLLTKIQQTTTSST